jgi:hypothetical protein
LTVVDAFHFTHVETVTAEAPLSTPFGIVR